MLLKINWSVVAVTTSAEQLEDKCFSPFIFYCEKCQNDGYKCEDFLDNKTYIKQGAFL